MSEMIAFPLVVVLVLSTAVLSSIITTSLPHMGRWFNAFKDAIKRKFTRKPTPPTMWYCDDLQSQVDELQEQVNNLAERLSTRDRNRKSNIRRDVRDYLLELKNEK